MDSVSFVCMAPSGCLFSLKMKVWNYIQIVYEFKLKKSFFLKVLLSLELLPLDITAPK